jgi:hypothetical protein
MTQYKGIDVSRRRRRRHDKLPSRLELSGNFFVGSIVKTSHDRPVVSRCRRCMSLHQGVDFRCTRSKTIRLAVTPETATRSTARTAASGDLRRVPCADAIVCGSSTARRVALRRAIRCPAASKPRGKRLMLDTVPGGKIKSHNGTRGSQGALSSVEKLINGL